jgi:hypothetical protein
MSCSRALEVPATSSDCFDGTLFTFSRTSAPSYDISADHPESLWLSTRCWWAHCSWKGDVRRASVARCCIHSSISSLALDPTTTHLSSRDPQRPLLPILAPSCTSFELSVSSSTAVSMVSPSLVLSPGTSFYLAARSPIFLASAVLFRNAVRSFRFSPAAVIRSCISASSCACTCSLPTQASPTM